jgi:hypothetical protein
MEISKVVKKFLSNKNNRIPIPKKIGDLPYPLDSFRWTRAVFSRDLNFQIQLKLAQTVSEDPHRSERNYI